ncbi:hypothetical protein HanIR_Chr02g0068661 [Helianthus annuus]|nr:hypothetical protein HanIR_Chr02g0068661 [Helianthus annuus]
MCRRSSSVCRSRIREVRGVCSSPVTKQGREVQEGGWVYGVCVSGRKTAGTCRLVAAFNIIIVSIAGGRRFQVCMV